MPYTLSHAIVGYPLSLIARGKIPLAAIVVGSLSPDFPYLLALTPTEAPGHSALGVLIYCLLPSLIALFFWYKWLDKPTLELVGLPKRALSFDKRFALVTVLGVLIGAYSHVLWDASSHLNGAFVVGNELLQREYYSLPLYKWNQYCSGVLGLIGLLAWYLYSVLNNRHNEYRGKLWLGVPIYLACISLLVVIANVIHGSTTLSEYAVRSATGGMAGGFLGMCVYALAVNCRKRENIF